MLSTIFLLLLACGFLCIDKSKTLVMILAVIFTIPMENSESNTAKSINGSLFNKIVRQAIEKLLAEQKIKFFVNEPRYNFPFKQKKQFSPDGEITLLNNRIIIYDNTTTIRHDRLKQKLWDAYGVKEHFNAKDIQVRYFVVIPDILSVKETRNALNEKNKINDLQYYSSIDDIITLAELLNIIAS